MAVVTLVLAGANIGGQEISFVAVHVQTGQPHQRDFAGGCTERLGSLIQLLLGGQNV